MTFEELSISSKILYQEAQNLGIKCSLTESNVILKMQYRELEWYCQGSRTSVQSSVGYSIASDKALTKVMLKSAKVPTAEYIVVTTTQGPLTSLAGLRFPVVLKPLGGYHGHDVHVGIQTLETLNQILQTSSSGKWIVEEMLQGQEYRVVCVDNQYLAAARRNPAFVIGNGKDTIASLIDMKNANPYRGQGHLNYLTMIEPDQDLEKCLSGQGLTLHSVPQDRQRIQLRGVCNLSRGGEVDNVTELVCEENRQLFETISKVVDLNLVGIDVMCADISQPLIDQPKAGIIEINASPGLMIHHTPYRPDDSVNVGRKILEMTIKRLENQHPSSTQRVGF